MRTYAFRVPHTYQQIRDRIYEHARRRGLRVDWVETTRTARLVLLYDCCQVAVGRAIVPVRNVSAVHVSDLEAKLEHLFGKDWLR
jgi:hypothetical protein